MDMHLTSRPKISVCMAAYNSAPYIEQSIKSILTQTFTDFELIIVNDGSTDATTQIINSFKDSRIHLIHNDKNEGLVFTRNRLLNASAAELIAVLDSDDIAYPERLEIQYKFMQSHPQISLCGGHANIIDKYGKYTGEQFTQPVADNYAFFMLFGSMFINSSTMFRNSVFKQVGGYRDYAPAEDFDLFMRIAAVGQVKNLDHVLVKYRIHRNNISTLKREIQKENELRLIANLHDHLNIVQDDRLLSIHLELFSRNYNKNHFEEYASLLKTLKFANRKSIQYPIDGFEAFLFNKWIDIINDTNDGGVTLSHLFKKDIFRLTYITFKQLRRAFKKSLKMTFK